MKKRLMKIICVLISIMLVTSIIYRAAALQQIGASFFQLTSLTEILSFGILVIGIIMDIGLITYTYKMK